MGCMVFLFSLAVKQAPGVLTVGDAAAPSLLPDRRSCLGFPSWFYTQSCASYLLATLPDLTCNSTCGPTLLPLYQWSFPLKTQVTTQPSVP